MTSEHSSPAGNSQLLARVVIVLIPLAAFLSFSIQPIMGKLLLPSYGGSAEVWLASITFFQIALLGGYAWAAWLGTRPARVQGYSMVILAGLALMLTRFSLTTSATGFVGIFFTLLLGAGPAMLLLFSISPLMHTWLRRQEREIPYYLYSISNAGSLAGLLLYPFVWERTFTLSEQVLCWRGLFAVVVALVTIGGYLFFRVKASAPVFAPSTPLLSKQKAILIFVSALTTINMLSATGYIAGEIGSAPLTWVGPFGIYILSFSVIFSGIFLRWIRTASTILVGVALSGYSLTKGLSAVTVSGTPLWWLLALTAGVSFLGNVVLYQLRPKENSDAYYLSLAFGGALGGLCSLLIFPNLLSQPFEFIGSGCCVLTMGIIPILPSLSRVNLLALGVVLFAPIFGIIWNQTHQENPSNLFFHFRNVYGFTTVNITDNGTILSNETTTHGSQITKSPEGRRHPTMYYSESTAVGRILELLKTKRSSINVGVVGLGAGTLAAYSRQLDTITFWDIDPKAIRIAKKYFSYLSDCLGTVKIEQQDGRKGIGNSSTDFDLIVIDAFAGDSIPSHLLTTEALQIYRQRLSKRHGILLIHASNRYSSLFPIVSSTAHAIGCTAINIETNISESTPDLDYDKTLTQYIAVVDAAKADEFASYFPLEEDKGRIKRVVTVAHLNPNTEEWGQPWSDNFSSTFDVLDVNKYLGISH